MTARRSRVAAVAALARRGCLLAWRFAQAPARFGFGRPATPAEIAAIDIDIRPDGAGLPAGRGTAAEGAAIYGSKCASCHGKTGKGRPERRARGPRAANRLSVRAGSQTAAHDRQLLAVRHHGVRLRAPRDAADGAGLIDRDEVFALTAFLLHANELIAADAVMDRTTLPKVQMPARQYFTPDTRMQTTQKPRP